MAEFYLPEQFSYHHPPDLVPAISVYVNFSTRSVHRQYAGALLEQNKHVSIRKIISAAQYSC
jgi:hypothetical protein